MKRILTILLMLVCTLTIWAQSISVSSFRLLETDLTANTKGTIEKDQNGEVAALIKVVTTQTGFTFDGGVLGIVKAVQKPAEIWVYVPRGIKRFSISHPQLGALKDYNLPLPIESARTYEMVLLTGTVETVVGQSRTSQAEISSSPAMADIYIDEIKVGQTPQIIEKLLIGQHKLRINKHGYEDYSTTFDVKEGETTKISASLEKVQIEQVAVDKSATDNSDANDATNLTSSDNDRKDITVGNVSFTMIHVDGGTFMMGGTGEQGGDAYPNEKPDHPVTLSPYYIGETEVTQALWEAVMGNNPSNFKGNNKPVEQVSWNDCQDFIRKLNQKTGLNFRLPTEAEWEYAARGGNKSKGYKYSGGNNSEKVAWKQTLSIKGTRDVKTMQANELGLYDMSGNVDEWCQDWYGKYSDEPQTDPTGPSTGTGRLYRGGSYFANVRSYRVSSRSSNQPSSLFNTIGLRLVLQ